MTYVTVPQRDMEAARENRELRRLALATDRRLKEAEQAAAERRQAQEAHSRRLARIQRQQTRNLTRCAIFALTGAVALASARLGLVNPWLALSLVGGLLVALGFNLAEAVRLAKEARKC